MEVKRHEVQAAPTKSELPSDIVTKAADTACETDEHGRVITVKRLNALQYYRLTKAMGGSAAANQAAIEFASVACAVVAINGEPIDFPSSEKQVEFLIQRLDFDGWKAAAVALGKLNGDDAATVDTAKN